jgi:nucleotidyltransferase/DNA polymerase involved in DNA repair
MPIPMVGHVDGDAFYVNAERVRDRYLRGRPVGVISNQGYFVIAKSGEMKRCGVTTGEPLPDAIKKCPDGIYVKRDFQWYEIVSHRLLDAVRLLSPQVEYYSIDELFFTVPKDEDPQTFAERLRGHILDVVGIPATVGVSRSRTLAKLIGDTAKPYGAKAVCHEHNEREYLKDLDITEVSGIAGRRARRLLAHGIKTCLDFVDADPRLVRQILTVVGLRLWHELRGESVEPIRTCRPRHKIISRGGSIGRASADPVRVWSFVVRNLERFIEALQFHHLQPGRISLYVQYREDLERHIGTRLLAPSDRFDVLLAAFKYCFKHCWVPGRAATRMHLFGAELQNQEFIQPGLFDPPNEQARLLADAKRKVNDRIGRFAVRSAQTLFLNDVYCDDANNYESCDVQGKMVF